MLHMHRQSPFALVVTCTADIMLPVMVRPTELLTNTGPLKAVPSHAKITTASPALVLLLVMTVRLELLATANEDTAVRLNCSEACSKRSVYLTASAYGTTLPMHEVSYKVQSAGIM